MAHLHKISRRHPMAATQAIINDIPSAELWAAALQLIRHEAQKPYAGLKMFLEIAEELPCPSAEWNQWKNNLQQSFAALNQCIEDLRSFSLQEPIPKTELKLASLFSTANIELGHEIFVLRANQTELIWGDEVLLRTALRKFSELVRWRVKSICNKIEIICTPNISTDGCQLNLHWQIPAVVDETPSEPVSPRLVVARLTLEQILKLHGGSMSIVKESGHAPLTVWTILTSRP